MGRAKLPLGFIVNKKARNTTYAKRKRGMLKKAHEFSVLCNVPVCIIIYPYNEGKPSLEAEVYSYKGDSKWDATNPTTTTEIIERYLSIPNDEKYKRSLNLCDMFNEWKRKAEQELSKLRHKNALAKYPSWDSRFDGLTSDQLKELLAHLDQKIEIVGQRIGILKSNNNNNANHVQETAALIPYFDHQPTPTSNLMIPNENSGNQIGYPYSEGYNNQFSFFNYPINNFNYNFPPLLCHQLMPTNFNYPNVFPDNQLDATRMDDHASCSSHSNLAVYNTNMMAGVGPMYYNQGLGIVDDTGTSSSYGGGLPITSMPLQSSLSMLPNGSLQPRQRQYQMFYN